MPPPGVGLKTVMVRVPVAATSVPGIVAVSWLELTNVVARSDPFTRTTEFPTKFVPSTVSVNPPFPTVTVAGAMAVVVGTGFALTVNVCAFDVPPPGAGLKTVIVFDPVVARSVAEIAAVSCVELTNVVVLSDPFQRTIEPATKFVPLTVSVNAPSPATRLLGEMLVVVGAGFGGTLKVAVTDELLLVMVKLHGFVAPEQVVLANGPDALLHPANTEPVAAAAVSVPCWLLSTDRVHVAVHEAGFGDGTKFENETVPPPVPAKVMVRFFAAATYGPTNGPPPPIGGEPAGVTGVDDVSVMARPRFNRPLPVWLAVPAGSAFRARRPTMTPFVAANDDALSSAAAPATSAAAADVPLIVV
jgi:hypothetical protein